MRIGWGRGLRAGAAWRRDRIRKGSQRRGLGLGGRTETQISSLAGGSTRLGVWVWGCGWG